MNSKLVSIIIPNYNHASFLRQRLDSVFNQTYQHFEVILLDDCSTDSSIEILQEYGKHSKVSRIVINNSNSGSPFKQWQKGIKMAKGDYIWIAESDDYCTLDFLDKMVQLLEENKHAGLTYCQSIDVNEFGDILLHRIDYTKEFYPNIWECDFELDGFQFVEKYLSAKNVIPNASAVVFNKQLVTNLIFSKELIKMRMCGDWFFWIQLILKNNVVFLAEELNYFRNHYDISRNHMTNLMKRQRLMEEAELHNFLFNRNLGNIESETYLYKRWFQLNGFLELFSSEFYQIKLLRTSFFKFVFYFIQFKLRNKLTW